MKKRILSLLLCLAVMLSLSISVGVSAAYTQDDYIRSIMPGTTLSELKTLLTSVQSVSVDGVPLANNDTIGTGYDISTTEGTRKAVVLADVSGTGSVSAVDYLMIKRYFLGTYTLEGENLLAADIDESGTINSLDYLAVKRHFLGTYEIGSLDNADSVPILLYHHILLDEDKNTEQWMGNDITISTTEFRRHMQLIRNSGYTVITMQEAVDYVKGLRTIPVKSVVLCFDDGYKSNTEYAAPILRDFDYPATIFHIMSGYNLPYEADYDPTRLQKITQVDMADTADVFDYQCHTYANHNYLDQQSYQDIYDDLLMSQNTYATKYFAYPYGRYASHVIDAVEAIGHEAAFTTESRAAEVGEGVYEIPRFTITSPMADSTFLSMLP